MGSRGRTIEVGGSLRVLDTLLGVSGGKVTILRDVSIDLCEKQIYI
jgi:hypothetical protein